MTYVCGDILYFVTAKVAHSRPKPKFHVCICAGSGLFLFINSDPFEGSFRITQADFDRLPKEESFVSCNAPVSYSASALSTYNIDHKGRLTDDCLKRLMAHVEQSEVMTEEDIETVVSAIFFYLSRR